MTHVLRCDAESFAALKAGRQTHEIRWATEAGQHMGGRLRFAVGDVIDEREVLNGYRTGNFVVLEVTHITMGPASGLPNGLVVMSVQRVVP